MKISVSFSLFILMCVIPGLSHAQLVTISGYVTNTLTGSAIENVSVFEKRSEIGTISSKDGFFQLMLHPGKLNLSISENGFKSISENLVLKNDTTIVIQLKPQISAKNRNRNEEIMHAGADKETNLKERNHFPK